MALKSICFRIDSGVVISVKDIGHEWSDIERGLVRARLGFYYATAEMEVSDDQISFTDPDSPTPCIALQQLKVNDTENPTSLVEV